MINKLLENDYFKAHKRSRELLEIAIHTYREWSLDGTLRIGAGIAYYGIIALVPLLMVAVGIAEIFFTTQEITEFISGFVFNLFGDKAADLIPSVQDGVNKSVSNLTNIGLFGLGALFFSATLIFLALQDGFNVIWKTRKRHKFSIWRYVYSFLVMLVTVTTMTAILMSHAILSYAKNIIPYDIPLLNFMTGVTSIFVVFAIVTACIMFILKSFVKIGLTSKDLLISSGIISAFLYLGIYGLAIYFSNFANKSIYGALAGFILILVAVYYFSQIFLAGAELSKVIAYRNGNKHLQKELKKSDPRYAKNF